jgi:hypothetical protein
MMNRKTSTVTFVILALVLVFSLAASPAQASQLYQTTDTPPVDPTATIEDTQVVPQDPTATIEDTQVVLQDPTETPEPPENSTFRPVLVIQTYSADRELRPGSDFSVTIMMTNTGQHNAYNVIFSFTSGDLIARDSGGMAVIPQIVPGETRSVKQSFTAVSTLVSGSVVSVPVAVNYTDQSNGTSYSSSFDLSFNVGKVQSGPALPTVTPTAIMRPQLVISSYSTDVNTLQPGSEFKLKLEIRNLGSANARGVSLVIGGGSGGGTNDQGTPVAGGVTGTGGDFSVFAPLYSSNVIFMGDVRTGEAVQAEQSLIVNVTANPGTYSPKFSFIYMDDKGVRYIDDQVITLLVYSLPMVDINFYQTPGEIYAGQPSPLPLQVTNMGRKSAVLGNMEVTVANADVQNGIAFVGTIDPGGYFPLDAMLTAFEPGPATLNVTINYTDDFNQARSIVKEIPIEVLEMPVMDPGLGGPDGMGGEEIPVVVEPETFTDKVVRFLKGMVGLDSAVPTPEMSFPVEELPAGEGKPSNGGGGGGIIVQPAPGKG